jgi:MoaA/NifB/PqqE/SkfB family radical SAM enzyme
MNISKVAYDNAMVNLQECKEKLTRLTSYPLKLYIEPTIACNLRCSYCLPQAYRKIKKKHLNMDVFYALEEQLFDHACEVNLFLRGEPTLAPHFPEMLSTCAKYPFITKFFSNLSYKNDAILADIVEKGAWLNVSLDGLDEKENMREGIDFDRVIRNIRFVQECREKNPQGKFHLRIAVVVSKLNVHRLSNMVEWADSMNIREIMFGCLDGFIGIDKYTLTSDDSRWFADAVKRADELNVRISTPTHVGGKKLEKSSNWNDFGLAIDEYFPHFCEDCNPDVEQRFCPYPWIQTVIQSDGSVVSCCQRKLLLGWFTPKKDFIKDIWNNRRYRKLRSKNDFTRCKTWKTRPCTLTTYSIWGGERRLSQIPGPLGTC